MAPAPGDSSGSGGGCCRCKWWPSNATLDRATLCAMIVNIAVVCVHQAEIFFEWSVLRAVDLSRTGELLFRNGSDVDVNCSALRAGLGGEPATVERTPLQLMGFVTGIGMYLVALVAKSVELNDDAAAAPPPHHHHSSSSSSALALEAAPADLARRAPRPSFLKRHLLRQLDLAKFFALSPVNATEFSAPCNTIVLSLGGATLTFFSCMVMVLLALVVLALDRRKLPRWCVLAAMGLVFLVGYAVLVVLAALGAVLYGVDLAFSWPGTFTLVLPSVSRCLNLLILALEICRGIAALQ